MMLQQSEGTKAPQARLPCVGGLAKGIDGSLQLGCGLVGDLPQSRLIGKLSHHLGVHRVDDHRVTTSGGVGAHGNVARQQQADLAVGVHRAVRQRRVTGAEDQVILHVFTEFGLQRRLHVDFGKHTKTLVRQRFTGSLDRILERGVQRGDKA